MIKKTQRRIIRMKKLKSKTKMMRKEKIKKMIKTKNLKENPIQKIRKEKIQLLKNQKTSYPPLPMIQLFPEEKL